MCGGVYQCMCMYVDVCEMLLRQHMATEFKIFGHSVNMIRNPL